MLRSAEDIHAPEKLDGMVGQRWDIFWLLVKYSLEYLLCAGGYHHGCALVMAIAITSGMHVDGSIYFILFLFIIEFFFKKRIDFRDLILLYIVNWEGHVQCSLEKRSDMYPVGVVEMCE